MGHLSHAVGIDAPLKYLIVLIRKWSFLFRMPTEYKRKCPERARWSQESLAAALQAINSGNMGINEASRAFGIPFIYFVPVSEYYILYVYFFLLNNILVE